MPLIFSYGTLQQEDVQLSTFGRVLHGHSDELVGFECSFVQIEDPRVVAMSGKTHHANVTFDGRHDSRVSGAVFEIADTELAAADAYECQDAYKRIVATLASGKQAWVYLHDDSITVSAIIDLEQRLAQAWLKGDRMFIDALLAPDWRVTDPSGRILTKPQVLDEAFSSGERKIDTMVVDDINVQIMGTAAVATGRTRATGTYQGQIASVVLRFTDVFVRRNGAWQVRLSQGTLVAP